MLATAQFPVYLEFSVHYYRLQLLEPRRSNRLGVLHLSDGNALTTQVLEVLRGA